MTLFFFFTNGYHTESLLSGVSVCLREWSCNSTLPYCTCWCNGEKSLIFSRLIHSAALNPAADQGCAPVMWKPWKQHLTYDSVQSAFKIPITYQVHCKNSWLYTCAACCVTQTFTSAHCILLSTVENLLSDSQLASLAVSLFGCLLYFDQLTLGSLVIFSLHRNHRKQH